MIKVESNHMEGIGRLLSGVAAILAVLMLLPYLLKTGFGQFHGPAGSGITVNALPYQVQDIIQTKSVDRWVVSADGNHFVHQDMEVVISPSGLKNFKKE